MFANAGIVERDDFYAVHDQEGPPPLLDMLVVDVDYKSVVTTAYLAQHYFRRHPSKIETNLIMTASVGGLYPAPQYPLYCGAKHGVVGFMRSIAARLYQNDRIRVNAICPGTVATNLLPKDQWDAYPQDSFVPIEKVVDVVEMLLEGGEHGKGQTARDNHWGQAVEISGRNHYFREHVPFCDEAMEKVMSCS